MDKNLEIMGTIDATVTDAEGRVLRSDTFRMDSWVDNFAWLFWMIVGLVFKTTAGHYPKNTAGTSLNQIDMHNATYGGNDLLPGDSGETDRGIVIGTSDDAFAHDQNALVTPIAHGSGSGQMLYSPEVPVDPAWSSTKWTMSKQRIFNNVSGASITVKEFGIYHYSAAIGSIMLARDVPSPYVVPNAGTLTITYNFELTA